MTTPCRTPADWDRWCDDFEIKYGRANVWDELILAVQADARGEPEPAPLTPEELAQAGYEHAASLAAWKAPTS